MTSSSQEKLRRAAELGAVSGFNYRQPDWTDQLSATAGNPDLIIDSAAGPGYAALLDVAAHGGRIVNYGATAGPPEKLAMFKVFWKQLRLQGSTMGSPADFAGMLSLVNATEVQPAIDQVLPLEEVNTALALMANSQQFGKLVLAIP